MKYQKNAFSIIIIFICLVIIGILSIPRISLQLNPSRSLPELTVRYSWPDASARVIEREVTSKLEGIFSVVQGLESISSVTHRGYGRIHIEFKKNVNIDAVRFEIANLVRQSYHELPSGVSYPNLSLSTSGEKTEPLLTYTLNSPASSFFIKKYADENITDQLSRIPGVGSVVVYGATPYQWQIIYDTELLSQLGLGSRDISNAVNNYLNDEQIGLGFSIRGDTKQMMVLFTEKQHRQILMEKIPIKNVGGRTIFLADVARIRYQEKEPDSYFRINGLNTINIVIYPEQGANNIRLSKEIKQRIEQVKNWLSPGFSLLLSYDETEYLHKELNMIMWRLLFSTLILFVFVFLVSKSLKYLFLMAISIMANLIIAVLFYYLLDLEIHLYSLAGITISLGIIIDNSIIMIEHLRSRRDKKVLLAIVAATFTTVGALSIVFLLKEEQQVNLLDFAWVIAVNLLVSIIIAWYFIPALMEKISLRRKKKRLGGRRKRRIIRATGAYLSYIRFARRFRWLFIIVLILSVGIPIQWLPDKLEGEGYWKETYNEIFDTTWFKNDVKPVLGKLMGGSLRLFTEYVYESSYYASPERTTLHVRGSMPEGCTVQQMDKAIRRMENFINQFEEVEFFNTSITSYQNSQITIYFKEPFEGGSFPYLMKSRLESKAISLGGLDWSVYGVGRGFSNALSTGYRNSRINLEGYNYEELSGYAELLRSRLLNNPRIKEVDITGPNTWGVTNLHEYYLKFDDEKLALLNISKAELYDFLRDRGSNTRLKPIFLNGALEEVVLRPDTYEEFDVWNLNHAPLRIDDQDLKFAQLGSMEIGETGNEIHKHNQQYLLVVAYDFIGPDLLGKKVQDKYTEEISAMLPLGFKAYVETWSGWDKKDKSQYYLLLYVVLLIFIICSIIFESLRQPFAIIFLIPISFIGIFLTFYLFDINFDQGGFAAFVMVCGLVVNAGIYIINDYNNFRKGKSHLNHLRYYLKAFNYKCMPIFLTILSTVIGLVPFLWNGQDEVFWYAFAAGTVGGLIFSLLAVLLYLPLFIGGFSYPIKNK